MSTLERKRVIYGERDESLRKFTTHRISEKWKCWDFGVAKAWILSFKMCKIYSVFWLSIAAWNITPKFSSLKQSFKFAHNFVVWELGRAQLSDSCLRSFMKCHSDVDWNRNQPKARVGWASKRLPHRLAMDAAFWLRVQLELLTKVLIYGLWTLLGLLTAWWLVPGRSASRVSVWRPKQKLQGFFWSSFESHKAVLSSYAVGFK